MSTIGGQEHFTSFVHTFSNPLTSSLLAATNLAWNEKNDRTLTNGSSVTGLAICSNKLIPLNDNDLYSLL